MFHTVRVSIGLLWGYQDSNRFKFRWIDCYVTRLGLSRGVPVDIKNCESFVVHSFS